MEHTIVEIAVLTQGKPDTAATRPVAAHCRDGMDGILERIPDLQLSFDARHLLHGYFGGVPFEARRLPWRIAGSRASQRRVRQDLAVAPTAVAR
jgi:hypothetical protein